jgi:hypothetical protein
MKTLFLASALALSAGMSTAFATVITFSDGSTWNSAAPTAPTQYASNSRLVMSDATASHRTEHVKVVRFGPPDGGLGGA